MANNVSRYLKSIGINVPYEEMTEAQIQEANKANPLGSYGFMTANEKVRQRQQQRAYEQMLQQEQQERQNMMLMQSSPERAIGHYSGNAIFSGLSQILNKDKGQSVPQVPQNDPEIDRYNQLVAEVGEAGALEILGQETGDASMITQAKQLRQAEEERALEIEDKKSQIAERKGKPNTTLQAQFTGPDGKPMLRSLEIVGKGPNGENIYRELGSAVKGSVNDTNEGWSNTKGGVDKRAAQFESALTSTANALDAYDAMDKLVKETPNALGWAGKLISQADNIVAGLQNLGETIATAEGRKIEASMDIGEYDWGKLEKVAASSDKMKSLVFQLAYAQAAATGDSSRSLSDRDIQNQIDIIGGQISNPKTFASVMEQNKKLLVKKLENMGKYSKINGESVGSRYQSDLDGLRNRIGQGGGTITMFKNGKKYNIPEDRVKDAEAKGYTRG